MNEDRDDQGSNSSNAESESLDLDQPKASGVQKSPEISNAPEKQATEEDYITGQENVDADQGNLLCFDLSDFFGKEYMSFLDSIEPHQALHTQPSVAIDNRQIIWKPISSNHCRSTTNTLLVHSSYHSNEKHYL